MTQFVIHCTDTPPRTDLKAERRQEHLNYLGAAGDALVIARRYVDAEGATRGSMIIVEVPAKPTHDNSPKMIPIQERAFSVRYA